MVEYFDGFNNSDDVSNNSIFQARIREEDLAAEEKINEIVRAAEKLVRDATLQEQSCGQINQQIQSELNGLLDRVESCVEESDTESNEGALQKIYECLKNFFSTLGISVNEPGLENYLLKLKKERDKNWLLSIIKELCDKLRKLLSKVFKENLSWDEALEKEIKELQEKLDSGDLSEEEMVGISERLEALRAMKLKFQMAFVSLVLTSFFTFLEINLRAAQAQETSTEENKKIESKEPEVKQAKENAEGDIKVSKENKKELQPITPSGDPARDARTQKFKENEGKKPIIPFKPDLDLLNLLEGLKLGLGKFIAEPKSPAEEKPRQTAAAAPTPPPPAPVKAPEAKPVQDLYQRTGVAGKEERIDDNKNLSQKEVLTTKSANKQESNFCRKFSMKITRRGEKPEEKQNLTKAEPNSEKVRSELNAIKGVESAVDVSCGRVM